MNNAVGRADVFALLEKGVMVGIGTDGMTPDLRREVMTGYLMHKHHVSDNNLGWVEYEQMAMRNNYAIYERLSGQKIGRIAPDYLADLILVDYYAPQPPSVRATFGAIFSSDSSMPTWIPPLSTVASSCKTKSCSAWTKPQSLPNHAKSPNGFGNAMRRQLKIL